MGLACTVQLKKAVFSLIIIFLSEDQMASLVASLDATAHGAHLTTGTAGVPAGTPVLGILEQQLSVRAVVELLEAQGLSHVAAQVHETAWSMAGSHRGAGGALAARAVAGAGVEAGVGGESGARAGLAGERGSLGPLGDEPLFSEGELGMLLVRHNTTLSQVRRHGRGSRRRPPGNRTNSISGALSPASLRPNGTVWYTGGHGDDIVWRSGSSSWQQLKRAGTNLSRNLTSLKSIDSLQSLSPKAAKSLSRKPPPGASGGLYNDTKPKSVTKSRSAAPRMFQTRSSVELRQLAPDRTPGSDASFHQVGESPSAAAGSSLKSGARFNAAPNNAGGGGGKLSGVRSESATKYSSSVHGERLYQAAFLKLGSES